MLFFAILESRTEKARICMYICLPQGQSIILIVIHVLFNRRTKLINNINNIYIYIVYKICFYPLLNSISENTRAFYTKFNEIITLFSIHYLFKFNYKI